MTKERKEQEDRGEMEEGPGEESGERSRQKKRMEEEKGNGKGEKKGGVARKERTKRRRVVVTQIETCGWRVENGIGTREKRGRKRESEEKKEFRRRKRTA